MFLFSLSFLCGILILQSFSHLPHFSWLVGIIFFIVLYFLFFKKSEHYLKLILPTAGGFIWAWSYACLQLSWSLPPELEGKPLKVTGVVSSIPDREMHATRFRFLIQKIQFENKIKSPKALVQLSWQEAPEKLHVGDQWQFLVHLKRIHSLMNPGGFNYETWSFQEGIRATGYVVSKEGVLISSAWYHHLLDRLREYINENIKENLPKTRTSSWLTALALGERHDISPDDWQVLRNTGTNHLMAIAGLHIGFMATFFYRMVAWIWRRRPQLTLKIPAQHAGAIAALAITFIYSAMAGFSIPTQRACLMLSLFLITLLLRRKILSWPTWSAALFFILLSNPLSVLTASFWLSFGSVALIIYGMSGYLAPKGLWWKHGRIQWVIAVGLIPLSIGWFQQYSLVSFVANSIAIPCIGFFVVPLTVFGCFFLFFSAKLGAILLWLADKVLSLLWIFLVYLSHLSWASCYQAVPTMGYIIIACIGIVILLLPVGFPGRVVGILWLLPCLMYRPPHPAPGDVWLTLLDVGQGLSTVVQTQHHILVFDAGARLSDHNDMGENVVVPFLRSLSVRYIDRLVISHSDNDHIGGAPAILKQIPTYLIESSVPYKFPAMPASYCLRGETWQWDQVIFQFLYPTRDKLSLDNNSSCVLRITTGNQHILLTGDIEKLAEEYLMNFSAADLAADILVAPHHGSRTSALNEFIFAIHPHIVLFSVGYRNRYHFPDPAVVKKYQNIGAELYDTVHAGAIQIQLKMRQLPFHIALYRFDHQGYWSDEVANTESRE